VPLRATLIAGLLLCAGVASAAEIGAVCFYTRPETVQVNQPFELWVDVELPLGCEAQNLNFTDFPPSTEQVSFGPFAMLPKTQRTADGGRTVLGVLHAKAQARATVPVEMTLRPKLQCMLTERTVRGFFSSTVTRPAQRLAEPFTLRVVALPEEGRPPDFSGAVGAMKLDARLSSATAQVGDILTLSVAVSGNGDLRNVAMPVPQAAEGFKVYPLKEKVREMETLQSEQVFIPQSTNAVEIGAVRFSYFNPATRRYEEAVAGPFRVTFTAATAAPQGHAVRVINTAPSSDLAGQGVTLETVNHGIRRSLPMLVFCAFALVACFVFFQLYGTHTRVGILAALLLLMAGGGVAYQVRATPEPGTRSIDGRAEIRFAPSEQARLLFVLHPGTPVTPIETAGDWVRVDYAGRRGWVLSRLLREEAAVLP